MSANHHTKFSQVDVLVLAKSAVRPGMPNAEAGPVALLETINVAPSIHPLVAVYRYALLMGKGGLKIRTAAHDDVVGTVSELAFATVRDASPPHEHQRLAEAWGSTPGWLSFDEEGFGEVLNQTSDGDLIVCAFPRITDAVLADVSNILAAVYGAGGVYDLRTVAQPLPRKPKRAVGRPKKSVAA